MPALEERKERVAGEPKMPNAKLLGTAALMDGIRVPPLRVPWWEATKDKLPASVLRFAKALPGITSARDAVWEYLNR